MFSKNLENVKGIKPGEYIRDLSHCREASGKNQIGIKHWYTINNNLKRFYSEFLSWFAACEIAHLHS